MLLPWRAASSVDAVASRLRVEPVALQHAVVERRVRIDRRFVDLVKFVKRGSAICLIRIRRQDRAVLSVGEGRFTAARQDHGGVLDVGGRQRGVRIVGRRREAARQRQQAFAFVVEDVLLLPIEIFDRKAVYGERAARVHPSAHGVERNREQLRIEPCRRLRRLGEEDLDFLTLRVHLVVALVLVVTERCEIPDLVFELTDFVAQHERREHGVRSPRQRTAQRRKLVNLAVELGVRAVPGIPVGIDLGEIPFEALGDLVALPQRWCGRRFGRFQQVHPTIIERSPQRTQRTLDVSAREASETLFAHQLRSIRASVPARDRQDSVGRTTRASSASRDARSPRRGGGSRDSSLRSA